MVQNFEKSLRELKGSSVSVSDANSYPEHGVAGVEVHFSDGSRLRADYWRIVISGHVHVSSFDHRQKYGLPGPIDAIAELQQDLKEKTVVDARFEEKTGDLVFQFTEGIELQVLNLTSYEVWEIHFSNGTGEYSNYAK
jgi:hypothetical protein